MSSSSKPSFPVSIAESPDALHERVVSQIAPFFLNSALNDQVLAQEATRQMLLGYNVADARELQLAAQIVTFGMAALDCLRCSMTERDMPVQALLRMRSNAVTLNRLAEKSRKTLDARRDRDRHQALTPEAAPLNEAEFAAAIGKAREMVTFARAKLEAHRVGKGLLPASASDPRTSAPPPAPAASSAPVWSILAAEQMTPQVLVRRKDADLTWAKDLGQLARPHGQTKH